MSDLDILTTGRNRTPADQAEAEAVAREQRDADAIDYIKRTQPDADLLLSMLGLDGEEVPSGRCPHCGQALGAYATRRCQRAACVAAEGRVGKR